MVRGQHPDVARGHRHHGQGATARHDRIRKAPHGQLIAIGKPVHPGHEPGALDQGRDLAIAEGQYPYRTADAVREPARIGRPRDVGIRDTARLIGSHARRTATRGDGPQLSIHAEEGNLPPVRRRQRVPPFGQPGALSGRHLRGLDEVAVTRPGHIPDVRLGANEDDPLPVQPVRRTGRGLPSTRVPGEQQLRSHRLATRARATDRVRGAGGGPRLREQQRGAAKQSTTCDYTGHRARVHGSLPMPAVAPEGPANDVSRAVWPHGQAGQRPLQVG